MVTITYEALDGLVNDVAREIEKTTGLGKGLLNTTELNTSLVRYLDGYGVQYEEELEDGLDELPPYELRIRAESVIGEDRVPSDVLIDLIRQFGGD